MLHGASCCQVKIEGFQPDGMNAHAGVQLPVHLHAVANAVPPSTSVPQLPALPDNEPNTAISHEETAVNAKACESDCAH